MHCILCIVFYALYPMHASLAWIRISIQEEEKEVKTTLDEYKNALDHFSSQIPETLHQVFATRMETINLHTEKLKNP